MITALNLSFAYDRGAPVLSNLNLDLPEKCLAVITGVNGSGKSTLLALLAGIFAPGGGELSVNGRKSPEDQGEIRKISCLVVQEARLQIIGGTVEEDLALSLEARGVKGDAAGDKVREAAEQFGLADKLESPVQTISWGQARKLCLAAAMLAEPRVLLLDEPLSGLDYPFVLEMRKILKANHRAGLTQIIAAHDLDPLADLATHIGVLHQGKMARFGEPKQVMPGLEKFGVRPPCSYLAGLGIKPWGPGND